jgi:lysophospholipase L1-like esterase
VIALGSNDAGIFPKPKHAELINSMMDHIGTAHYVMWVNIFLPLNQPRQQYWNTSLVGVAKERPDEMFVFDWAAIAAEHPGWMAEDQIHYTGKGYSHRASAIAEATRSLLPSVPARPRRLWTQIPAACRRVGFTCMASWVETRVGAFHLSPSWPASCIGVS